MAAKERESKIEMTELEPDPGEQEGESRDVKGGSIFATSTRIKPTIPTTDSDVHSTVGSRSHRRFQPVLQELTVPAAGLGKSNEGPSRTLLQPRPRGGAP